jgi:hypothetical protein
MAASSVAAQQSAPPWQSKIGFDLHAIGDDGLYGPPDGRRALDYELCVPRSGDAAADVGAIDPSARIFTRSRGRVGCRADQLLVLGTTGQAGFRRVLEALAGLPYVERIEPAWFE